jgi:hypothetical protein
MPAGRPSDYSPTVAEEICRRLIDGESLRKICEADDMPVKTTVLRWLIQHEEFQAQYTQARQLQAEGDLDDVVEIADDSSDDLGFKETTDKDGEGAKPIFLHDRVQRAKLRIETRLKRAEKMHPRKYGPQLKQEITGANGAPIPFAVTINLVKPADGAAGPSQG